MLNQGSIIINANDRDHALKILGFDPVAARPVSTEARDQVNTLLADLKEAEFTRRELEGKVVNLEAVRQRLADTVAERDRAIENSRSTIEAIARLVNFDKAGTASLPEVVAAELDHRAERIAMLETDVLRLGAQLTIPADGAKKSWPPGVTIAEYEVWEREQHALGITENVDPMEYKRLRDAGLIVPPKRTASTYAHRAPVIITWPNGSTTPAEVESGPDAHDLYEVKYTDGDAYSTAHIDAKNLSARDDGAPLDEPKKKGRGSSRKKKDEVKADVLPDENVQPDANVPAAESEPPKVHVIANGVPLDKNLDPIPVGAANPSAPPEVREASHRISTFNARPLADLTVGAKVLVLLKNTEIVPAFVDRLVTDQLVQVRFLDSTTEHFHFEKLRAPDPDEEPAPDDTTPPAGAPAIEDDEPDDSRGSVLVGASYDVDLDW